MYVYIYIYITSLVQKREKTRPSLLLASFQKFLTSKISKITKWTWKIPTVFKGKTPRIDDRSKVAGGSKPLVFQCFSMFFFTCHLIGKMWNSSRNKTTWKCWKGLRLFKMNRIPWLKPLDLDIVKSLPSPHQNCLTAEGRTFALRQSRWEKDRKRIEDDTLPETNSSPLEIGHPKETSIPTYSNHPFWGAMLVSGRVTRCNYAWKQFPPMIFPL